MGASLKTAIAAAGGIAVVVALTGCGGSSATPSGAADAPAASPRPSATSTAPGAPKDLLFTIAANVRDKNGNTIAIQLTAHKPVPYSASAATPLVDEFVGACQLGPGGTPMTADYLAANGSILVAMDLASSVTGKTFVSPIDLHLGSDYFGKAASGTGIAPADPTQPCSGIYTWSTSGTGRIVSDFESGNPGPDLTSWKNALYGFSVPADSHSTIEACRVTLTDAAKTTVAGVAGWDPSQAASGYACTIGYVGE